MEDRKDYLERYGNVEIRTAGGDPGVLEQGSPEDEKIQKLVETEYDCRRGKAGSWEVLYHLSHLRGNLTQWLPVRESETVLEFGADSGQLTGSFLKKAKSVICLEENISRCRILAKRYSKAENLTVYAGNPWKNLEALIQSAESGNLFDWIVAPELLADAGKYFAGANPQKNTLERILSFLKPEGHLVLAADNRFGLKYWAGAREPYTGRYFGSLEENGRMFSKRELEELFQECGCGQVTFYYPYPERWFPAAVYSDARLPKAGELNQNLRNFEGERLLLFDEEKVFNRLIADDRFAEFSNSYLCIVGPKAEEEIIYTKYSNDRAERFMLRTDIVKKTDGFEVRKVPVSEKAKKHVRDMKSWEETLDRLYKKNHISANRCELTGDTACFEFLSGRTFEEHLDELRGCRDYAGLVSELMRYRSLLMNTLRPELKPFDKSRLFVEMFGDPVFSKAYNGAEVNNLDWIFGNLMETESGIQIIDYEWTFPVQVPAEYLLWRALSLYLNGRKDLSHLGLMAQMGISSQEEEAFARMEHHFQLWLLDGTVTIGARYLETAGRTIELKDMLKTAAGNRMQIYTDTGSGFSETESYHVETEPDKQGTFRLELLLPKGTRAVRIDPAETACLVKVKRLLGELGGSYPLTCLHNGRELEDQGILYTTTDPQLIVSELVPGTDRLYAELTVEALYPDTAYACMNLLNRVRAAERIYGSLPFRFLKKMKRLFK